MSGNYENSNEDRQVKKETRIKEVKVNKLMSERRKETIQTGKLS